MSQFCIVSGSEVFEGNPFINNPHLKHIEPFKTLYDRDKSKDKKKASNEFYAVWIVSSPDEAENKYMKLSLEDRKKVVENSLKINWNDGVIQKCIEKYPELCLSIAEKTLKSVQDKLIERDAFLKASPYTMDYYMKDEDGKYVSRGNSFVLSSLPPKEIDAMIKLTTGLYDELAKAQKMFAITKDEMKIRGSRKATDLEDGTLFAGYV